jgi:hypothetical protein
MQILYIHTNSLKLMKEWVGLSKAAPSQLTVWLLHCKLLPFGRLVPCVDEPLLVLCVSLQLHDDVILDVTGQTLGIVGLPCHHTLNINTSFFLDTSA